MKRLLLAALVCAGLAAPAGADVWNIDKDIRSIPALQVENNLTVGGQTLAAVGTAALPAYAFVLDPDTGIYRRAANDVSVSTGGTLRASFTTSSLILWNLDLKFGSSYDVVLARIAADHLALVRETNPQKLSVYGTFTDASNYERGYLSAGTTGLIVGHEAAGTGTKREVRVQSNAKNVAVFSGTPVTMTDETAITVMTITVPDNSVCHVLFMYSNSVITASEYQGHNGTVSAICAEDPDAADSYACDIEEETEHVFSSSGTLTDTWATVAGASSTITGNFNSSLDAAGSLTLNVLQSSGCTITIP